MNDKLQKLLSAVKYLKASVNLLDSPDQRAELLRLALENEGVIVLKDANKYFQEFIYLNDEIQSDSWKGVFNLKKIREKANVLAELLNKKMQAEDFSKIETPLLNACSNLGDCIMLQGKYYNEVEYFDWLVGQTINAIEDYVDEDDDSAVLVTNDSPIRIAIRTFPCDECDEGYAYLINFDKIVYPGHEIIDVTETKIRKDGNRYTYEITVKYDDNQYRSFIYDCYMHNFECEEADVYGFIDLKF